jgi:hypothetical protein
MAAGVDFPAGGRAARELSGPAPGALFGVACRQGTAGNVDRPRPEESRLADLTLINTSGPFRAHTATQLRISSEEVAVTEPSKTLAGRLIDSFGEWLSHQRRIDEMEGLHPADFERMASSLGMSSGDLVTLVRKGPHAADELPKMLAELGINAEALSRVQPAVYHDMERVCARCEAKGRCDRDLASHTAAQHYEDYCLNASTIDALNQKPS